MTRSGLQHDTIRFDASGNPISALAHHVLPTDRSAVMRCFLAPTDSPSRWRRQDHWQVFEVGFAAGISFLETLLAWREYSSQLPAEQRTRARLSYVALERSPLLAADAVQLLRRAGYAPAQYQPLSNQWPDLINGFHRLSFDGGIELTLAYGDTAALRSELSGQADAIYLNQYATSGYLSGPVLSKPDLTALWRLCSPECQIAGNYPLGEQAASLAAAGFDVRQQLQRWSGVLARQPTRAAPFRATLSGRSVAVIGAGIAGLVVARHLASRGWTVSLIESADKPLSAGSGQPLLAGHLHLSPDDNYLTRLTRSAQPLLRKLPGANTTGRMHLATDQQDAERQIEIIDRLGWPAQLLSAMNVAAASDAAGVALMSGGIWQPDSQTLNPQFLMKLLPAQLRVLTASSALALEFRNQHWQVLDALNKPLASVDKVVVCTAELSASLIPGTTIKTQALVGQSTRLLDVRGASLRCVLGGNAYACPLADGSILAGASYRELPLRAKPADDLSNQKQWQSILADAGTTRIAGTYTGIRHATSDRLPLIGPAPDEALARQLKSDLHRDDRLPIPVMPGVYVATGFGSRGALWSALAAHIIADQLEQACLPIENSLAEAVAPQRFLRRAIRRGELS